MSDQKDYTHEGFVPVRTYGDDDQITVYERDLPPVAFDETAKFLNNPDSASQEDWDRVAPGWINWGINALRGLEQNRENIQTRSFGGNAEDVKAYEDLARYCGEFCLKPYPVICAIVRFFGWKLSEKKYAQSNIQTIDIGDLRSFDEDFVKTFVNTLQVRNSLANAEKGYTRLEGMSWD